MWWIHLIPAFAMAETPNCQNDRLCGRHNECRGLCKRDYVSILLSTKAGLTSQMRGRSVPLRWRRCAVVSSSDSLLRYSFGAAIDGHDAVFRINMSPTEGFENRVGSRTTVAVTNWPSWNRGNGYLNATGFRRRERPQIVVLQDPLIASDREKCCYKKTAAHYRRQISKALKWCRTLFGTCVQMHAKVPEVAWNLACRAVNATCPFAPSSGLITTVFAANHCQRTTIFGFGLPSSGGHYYDIQRKIGHEILPDDELSIFTAFHHAHNLNFSIAGLSSDASSSRRGHQREKKKITSRRRPSKKPKRRPQLLSTRLS